jgi:hypothetical protein
MNSVFSASLVAAPGPDVVKPECSRLFSRWRNPANGVESFILTERAAPVQQSFYYTHPSFSNDGRYLWLGCGFPPPGGMHSQQVLGVVDFQQEELRVFPETQFPSSRPLVDPADGWVYWGNHLEVWKRGPLQEDVPARVNALPKDLGQGRFEDIATHMTFSADGKSLGIDAHYIGRDGRRNSYIGDLPLDGSPFRLWHAAIGKTYNHGLFSPTDPDVQMIAGEYWKDHAATEPFDGCKVYHRLWLVRHGEEPRPILREPVTHSGHEWWDPDGLHVWYVHYGVGVKKVEVATGKEFLMWPGRLSHAHSDRTGRYLVADWMESPSNPECMVLFYDTVSGKKVEIVNRPPLAPHLTKCTHLHPHPQFCLHDQYICYTTTVHDRVDVALVPVKELIDRTS